MGPDAAANAAAHGPAHKSDGRAGRGANARADGRANDVAPDLWCVKRRQLDAELVVSRSKCFCLKLPDRRRAQDSRRSRRIKYNFSLLVTTE